MYVIVRPIVMDRIEFFGRNPLTDPVIRPLSGWRVTGKVEAGKVGPGCPVGCIYCNQMGMDKGKTGEMLTPYISFAVDGGISLNTRLMVGSKVEREIGIKQLIAELGQNPLYYQQSPLIFENFNDPGINWGHTSNLMETALNVLGHEGPFVFITKTGIKPKQVERLTYLQKKRGAKIIGIVTYAGMPTGIENSADSVRIATLRKLHDAGIPTILSIRPLIKGINDSPNNIRRILQETRGITDAVISGGLFVFDSFTAESFRKAGYDLPEEYTRDVYSLAKAMPVDYKPLVRKIAGEMDYPAVVHDHTTCAVADLANRMYGRRSPDRFPRWFNHNLHTFSDCGHCPPIQKHECEKAFSMPFAEVASKARAALSHIGYPHLDVEESTTVPKLLLVKDGALCFEELACLRERCGWYVDNLPNHQGFLMRAIPAIESDMTYDNKKLKYEDVIAGEVLVGQEWHVIFKNADDRLNAITLRWLRSRVRNRVQEISLEDLKQKGIEHYANMLAHRSGNTASVDSLKTNLSEFIN